MAQEDTALVDGEPDGLSEQITWYRNARERIERGTLPLATSVDGRTFTLQASLHGLELKRGAYVALATEDGQRLGQVTDLDSHSATTHVASATGASSGILVRLAVGGGIVLDEGPPFHDADVRPAEVDEVGDWFASTRPPSAALGIGELLLAPGVPAELDSGGFNRHTFMCGQSGSGKTYSLGLLLEQLLAETSLRVVILDPNSDYTGLGRPRPDVDPERAERYRPATQAVAVWGNEQSADRLLRLRFADLDPRTQGAVLGLDPVHDLSEYAVLTELLATTEVGDQLGGGLDALLGSSSKSARRLGQRATNLGVLDWTVWSQQDPSLIDELRQPSSRCLVVDLGSLDTLEEQRLVTDAVLSTLWSLRRQRDPVLVVMDEAHNICAADPVDALSRLSTDRAVQIAAEGRKYGLYLLVSTQRPGKVHENVVSQCDNVILMRMNSASDLAHLSRLFSFVPPGLFTGAPSFSLGQALVGGKIFPQGGGYVQMGDRVSEEGGADISTSWARSRSGS